MEKRSVSIRGSILTCQTCEQPTKAKELIDGVYCSVVCKALPNGTAKVVAGTYFNWRTK